MKRQQRIVLVLLVTFYAALILVLDLRIRPDLKALPLHLAVLCGVAIVGWLMVRYGSRWKYYKLFGALMGAAGFGGLTVETWHERHAWLTALFVVTTLANMAGIFDELGNLKKIGSTRGLENAE